MKDETDRTIKLTIRTNQTGSQWLFKRLSHWLDIMPNTRRIDIFEQRVDGVPMEKNDDDTKEFSKQTRHAC